MKVPEEPKDILKFICIIAVIGFIPTVLIHLLSLTENWNYFKPWFTTEAWYYLNWWLSVFPESAATFIAVYLAFFVEYRKEKKQFYQRVREILPYVFLELIENFKKMDEASDLKTFSINMKRFNVSSWNLYKEDISKWQEINVVPLKYIYANLDHLNNIMDLCSSNIPQEGFDAKTRAQVFLIDQIMIYEEYYKKNQDQAKELENVLEKYKKISERDIISKKVVEWILERKIVNIK